MLDISAKIIALRKARNWSQSDLAKEINSSRVMISNYERGDNLPSIEVVILLATAFNVSIDYLLGTGQFPSFDKEMLDRLENIEKLANPDKDRIYEYIDLIIRDAKARQAYQ